MKLESVKTKNCVNVRASSGEIVYYNVIQKQEDCCNYESTIEIDFLAQFEDWSYHNRFLIYSWILSIY